MYCFVSTSLIYLAFNTASNGSMCGFFASILQYSKTSYQNLHPVIFGFMQIKKTIKYFKWRKQSVIVTSFLIEHCLEHCDHGKFLNFDAQKISTILGTFINYDDCWKRRIGNNEEIFCELWCSRQKLELCSRTFYSFVRCNLPFVSRYWLPWIFQKRLVLHWRIFPPANLRFPASAFYEKK